MNSSMIWRRRSCRRSLSRALVLCLFLAAGAGCYWQSAPPATFVEGVDVLQYDVDLTVDDERLRVEGHTRIMLARRLDVEYLTLGLNGPTIDSILVDGAPVELRRDGTAAFRVALPARRDTVSVDVFYQGGPREGLYAATYGGTRIVYTDGWPDRVSGWMPGVHHPADPARLNLTLRIDPALEAVASGVREEVGPGVTRWQLDSPAPTYTFAFALAPYERREVEGGIPISHYVLPRDADAAVDAMERAGDALAFFEKLLGPYPYTTLSTVQVPFDFAGMENASSAFLSTTLYGTSNLEEVMVHEIAHQWFGNAVTIADWPHLWISEGITTYLTTLFYEHADGEEAAHEMRADFAHADSRDGTRSRPLVPRQVDSPYEMLTWLVYRKGAAVMHLIRLKLGDDAFHEALRAAYRDHRFGPASTTSLLTHFEQASPASLEETIDFWIYGRSLPRLVVEWDDQSRLLSWDIRDDGGTLAGVPFLLEVGTANEVWYVDAREQSVRVETDQAPTVRPVGIMMSVERR